MITNVFGGEARVAMLQGMFKVGGASLCAAGWAPCAVAILNTARFGAREHERACVCVCVRARARMLYVGPNEGR